jgi:CDP-diacylglycerol--serine O-phosphatidyltransferase
MGMGDLSRRLIETGPARRPRRAVYALPTLFTAGNIFLGFLAILRSVEGVVAAMSGNTGPNPHFAFAALMIICAVVLDALDGRVARMTGTTSDFGRELDSLADAITFGLAPAVLAYCWGVQAAIQAAEVQNAEPLRRVGLFVTFLFLACGAARLARFNIQKDPVPKNPGKPDRKYFVGLPIPAAAGLICAIIYAAGGAPPAFWPLAYAWLLLIALLSFLMVSTWRYRSFKELQTSRPRLLLIVFSLSLALLAWFTEPTLLTLTIAYVLSGIVIRVGGAIRRIFRHTPPNPPQPERQIG